MGWEFAPLRNIENKMPWAASGRSFLEELMGRNINYPTQEVAGLSQYEQQGMNQLADIMSGKAFRDPTTSPYYQGMRQEIARDTEKGASALRQRQNLGGMFRSGAGVREEGEYRGDMAAKALQILGSLFESESARDNPYTRLQAGMTYGAVPRQIQQQGFDASYNQQLQNLLAPFNLQVPLALQLMGYQPLQQASYQADDPSGLSSIMSLLGGAAGIAGPLMSGIGALGSIGKTTSTSASINPQYKFW